MGMKMFVCVYEACVLCLDEMKNKKEKEKEKGSQVNRLHWLERGQMMSGFWWEKRQETWLKVKNNRSQEKRE